MNHYPRHINAFASKYGYEKDYIEIADKLKRGIEERTKEYGAAAKNEMYF